LAEAWQVLSDPDQRAAYDRALARQPQPAPSVRITVRRSDAGRPGAAIPLVSEAGPPLRAGPVWVDGMPVPGSLPVDGEHGVALTLLAMWYLARDRRKRW
jgi:curved DNA-binding protein CbpA